MVTLQSTHPHWTDFCDCACDCNGNMDDGCRICNGPGEIYQCGCSDIPVGQCDCDGNVLDECGICGGSGIAVGTCDCAGNTLDFCGICNGPGQIYACGCEGLPF